MVISSPSIQTYHCLCSTLLLASTHTLSSLPRRSTSTGLQDAAIILPLSSTPPSFPPPSGKDGQSAQDMPPEGHSILLGLTADKKLTIIRREDGFEKRVLLRCSRCNIVVGYELMSQTGEAMELDMENGSGAEKGKGREEGDREAEESLYKGRVIYLLPGGIMSTEVMMGKEGRRVRDEDVSISQGMGVFE